jgi:hypothetical protein
MNMNPTIYPSITVISSSSLSLPIPCAWLPSAFIKDIEMALSEGVVHLKDNHLHLPSPVITVKETDWIESIAKVPWHRDQLNPVNILCTATLTHAHIEKIQTLLFQSE